MKASAVAPLSLLVLAIAILDACKKEEVEDTGAGAAPAVPSAPVHPAPTGAPRSASADRARLTWVDPEGLEKKPSTNPMRLATYRIPRTGSDADDGELAVFYFGPQGGGDVESNVKRWVGQFSGIGEGDVRRSERTVNGLVQHVVEIDHGTFSSGMPMGPQTPRKDYALIGVVVESSDGLYFFKATGPSSTLAQARPRVMSLLDSVKPRER